MGDTVNVASRMESNGKPDKIQVSNQLYDDFKNEFEFNPRPIIGDLEDIIESYKKINTKNR